MLTQEEIDDLARRDVLTAEEYQQYLSARKPKRSKYRNVKPKREDGLKFDSTRESDYFDQLVFLQAHGHIVGEIERQVRYRFELNGVRITTYIADFRYTDDAGVEHVVDVKGFRTPEYKLKAKMMLAFYGITIEEVR